MEIFDISPLVTPDIAVWPGDKSFSRTVAMDTNQGDHLTLSAIETTVHLGAHTDGPNHYVAGGKDISARSLHYYMGPAQVITVSTTKGQRIQWEDLSTQEIKAPRILLKTESYPDPNRFNEDFCSLSPELVDKLADAKALLIGIDTPSVDPFSSKDLEAHKQIHKYNMAILEGVVLSEVEDGLYNLVALPLKLKDADASPVRAVLTRG